MFIKLTQLPNYSAQDPQSRPAYVNPAFITYMLPYDKRVHRYDLRTSSAPLPIDITPVTSICFPAGLQEEADSIDVLETPEEIIELIGQ